LEIILICHQRLSRSRQIEHSSVQVRWQTVPKQLIHKNNKKPSCCLDSRLYCLTADYLLHITCGGETQLC